MIAVDASVLIAHLDPNDEHHDAAAAVLVDDEVLVTSVVTMAEVLVGPVRGGGEGAVAEALRRLGVVPEPVATEQDLDLAQLRARTRLKLPDCCVLLVARSRDVPLATFDRSLAARARDLGIDVIGDVVQNA